MLNSISSSSCVSVPNYVKLYDVISNYLVLSFHGEGSFAKVARCFHLETAEMVALKLQLLNGNDDEQISNELRILNAVGILDLDKNNIVRLINSFMFEEQLSCMAFEMLDISLYDLLEKQPIMSLNQIRPVLHQIMIALDALKSLSIMHTDLKLNNIMLVNHHKQPFRIKLIDFGEACLTGEIAVGEEFQNACYRAPEVMLGLRLTEAVDMWSVGCIMLDLFFRYNPFPFNCEYRWIKTLLTLFGQPEDHVLAAAKFSKSIFTLDEQSGWRLMTPKEYKRKTGKKPKLEYFDVKTFEDLVKELPDAENDLAIKDRTMFLDLLRCCLDLDPERRITPREALKHPFLTMVHMVDEMESSTYADSALDFMIVSPLENLDNLPADTATKEGDSAHKLPTSFSRPHDCASKPNDPEDVKTTSAQRGFRKFVRQTKTFFNIVAK